MSFFQTKRAYVLALAAYCAGLAAMIYALEKRSHMPTPPLQRSPVLYLVIDLTCAVNCIKLLKRTSLTLEKMILALTSLFFITGLLQTVAGYVFAWAAHTGNLLASTVLALASLLLGVRVIQITQDN